MTLENQPKMVKCVDCGGQHSARATSCPKCGAPWRLPHISPLNRTAALLLCFFLGYFGVHRFYVGKVGTGVLMIFTFGGLGIWYLIDLIMIASGAFRDKEGRLVRAWQLC